MLAMPKREKNIKKLACFHVEPLPTSEFAFNVKKGFGVSNGVNITSWANRTTGS